MNKLIQKGLYQIVILSSFLLLVSCVTNDFDLSEGINTEITIGGDSLSVPIGNTKPILLGDMLDSLGIDILKKSEDGGYSIHLTDSLDVKLNAIEPVVVNISPISIGDITTTVADIKFPILSFDPVKLTTNVNVPIAKTDNLVIPTINSSYSKSTTITAPPGLVKKYSNSPNKTKSEGDISFGPYEAEGQKTVTQSIPTYNFDPVLKKINKLYFKNNMVTVTFNKSQIRTVGFNSQQDEIVLFEIIYPSQFKLSNAVGQNARIVGSTFIIENSVLPDQDEIKFYYQVENLDLSGVAQNQKLDYTANIPYNVKYRLSGKASNMSVVGRTVALAVNITSTPTLEDLDIETNSVILDPSTGSEAINETVNDFPIEVDVINSLSFKARANLQLKIDDPGIQPFSFTGGNCIINLPKLFVFKPFTGLDLSTNKLTIPYSQLFGTKTIGIERIDLNKKVVDKKISITDAMNYSISGLTVGGATTKLSTTQSLGQKKINITASTSGLEVSDASVTTKQIAIDIPDQTANFSVNKLVSTDVKKIYSIGLKTPGQLEFKIDVSKVPTGVDSIFFDDYHISFPTSLKFKSDVELKNNQLILNRGFSVNKGFTKALSLESFDFGVGGLALENGFFVFNEKVTMTGKAYVKKSTLNTEQLKGIVISPKINVGTMNISIIEGLISQNVEPVSEIIDLGLPEMLKSGNNNLDIKNPVISLEIGNTMGIPLNLNLSLIPKRKGVAIPDASISTTLAVAAATNLGTYTFSKFWLAKSNEGVSQGYTAVILPTLPNLLRVLPDEIEVKGTAVITGTRHKVDLNSIKNALNIKYNINVPMDFGKDFKIQYRDTIIDLKKSLADYTGFSKKVDLIAIIKNGIPMDLGFTLAALDDNNNPINGITFDTKEKIKSCAIDAKPQTSIFTLGIRETEKDALSKLNAIDFTINANKNSTVAGIPLKSDQSVEIEIRVRIPDGITLKP